ncbi:cysteine hydrolase family protein [Pseudoxanthomonas sp. SL93]|uniref:cysteine hydrolase family protein n=1 Tax=Pseudoxanthomonas sp. SL93 TaxID=2995142 RepID=UPI00226FE40E|nr:cysteine hydrolase family protein [Pseudoxanthomonas sp. SL93]WAC61852.1 cysteine hydrolase family protein [Pseudoxanthomonas sp. SL93]
MKTALLLIDLQNDYLPDGRFPLWNTAPVIDATVDAIALAQQRDMLVVHIQHVSQSPEGDGAFFIAGTEGVKIHPRILAAAPEAPVVVKQFADAFHQTALEALLSRHGVQRLLVAGMMTQNCVTHTAISKAAEKYQVGVLADCTTTVSQPIHQIALHGLSTRVPLLMSADAF